MSERQIKEYFSRSGGRVCGRFRGEQLALPYNTVAATPAWKRWMVAASLVGLGLPGLAAAQESTLAKAPVEQRDPSTKGSHKAKLKSSAVSPATLDSLRVVRGKVTDPKGEALPGVSVHLKNTSYGAVTDKDGVFEIRFPDNIPNPELRVCFIGYETEEVKLGPTVSSMNVKLEEAVESLGEVVVIARKWSPRWLWWQLRGIF
ncbi:carboxypeptidase-like regulatory domain-containing protein [Cesiribacter sp. SM1]|uniref:carboxypeptidase-like regulatory domain-containing protein n=1 Tax=Cesiribacter sp. SM1 TaxID=2861196 RepID=UPI001CD317D5|nr:carboxypeptidase-like regulatory domain-containing protein [Cesiribacter sp. SM1]